MKRIMSFLRDEEGSNASEYALLLAFVAIVIATFGSALGDAVAGILGTAADAINSAGGGAAPTP